MFYQRIMFIDENSNLFVYKLPDSLTEEQARKCVFVLHTQVVDDNGTDLEAVREMLFGDDPKMATFIMLQKK